MLIEQLQSDLIAAMKAQDATVTGTLRLLLASVKNKQIDLGHALGDDEFLAVVQKEVKQRQDSIQQFAANARQDLADKELAELNILNKYMPAQLGEAEILTEVEKAIASTGATVAADMGKVMGALSHLKGQADMGKVTALVRQKLS